MNNEERYEAALAAFVSKNYEETIGIISDLLEQVSPHPSLLILLGRSYLGLDKPLDALIVLKKYRVDISDDINLLLLLGETYTSLFLNELAIQAFQRCLSAGEFHEANYYHFGLAVIQDNCIDKMINVFRKELEKNPSSHKLRYMLGIMYLYLKDKRKALLHAEQLKMCASSLAPDLFQMIEKDDPEADKISINKSKEKAKEHYLAALQLMTVGETEMAVKELVATLQLDNNFAEAYTHLGCLFDNCGLIDEGFTMHKKAIEVNPNLALAYNNIGYVYQVKGEYQKALDAYQKALELDPDLVQAHNSIGVLYDWAGDFEQGISHFKQALKLDPDRELTWKNLAVAYHALGKIDDSITALKEVIRINPRSLDARLLLVEIYKKLNRDEDADMELSEFAKITKRSE